jgi:hypothetical protein
MSGIISDNIGRASGLIKAAGGGGKVLQCLSATKTDVLASTSSTMITPSGLSVALTPAATSSKVLILVSVTGCFSRITVVTHFSQIVRDSTVIYNLGRTDTSEPSLAVTSNSGMVLDSPSSTSEIVYAAQLRGDGGAWTLNQKLDESGVAGFSSITAIEIGV